MAPVNKLSGRKKSHTPSRRSITRQLPRYSATARFDPSVIRRRHFVEQRFPESEWFGTAFGERSQRSASDHQEKWELKCRKNC